MKNLYISRIQSFYLIILFLLLTPISINSQTFSWAKSISDSESIAFNGITVDTEGNSYVTGRFQGSVLFDTVQLTSYGIHGAYPDVFITKYDRNGNCLWAKQAGGINWDESYGISFDKNGYLYITGGFIDSATFDKIHLSGFGGIGVENIFIAKYDTHGNCLWAKQAGSIGSSVGNSISIDRNGDFYITGWFIGSAVFDSIQLTGYGWDVFLAKYDSNGNCMWAKNAGSGSNTHHIGYSVSVDLNGNSYITGRFEGNIIFDTLQITSYGGYDIFISKYDPNGKCLWAKHCGGTSSEAGNSISLDVNQNSYITGSFAGSAIFDTIQLNSYGSNDIFIAKYDSNGNVLWAKHAGGISPDASKGISVDAKGNSYITGYFAGSVIFDTTLFFSIGDEDMFVAKYDNNGNYLWMKHAGGTGFTVGSSISIDANRDSYVSGVFIGTTNFGAINLSVDLYGAFITKISDKPVSVKLSSFTPPSKFELSNAYPNPWNPTTTIRYQVPINTLVTIKVFDALGREVIKLVNEEKPVGSYEVTLNGKNLSSGVYYYQMRAGNFIETKKIILIK